MQLPSGSAQSADAGPMFRFRRISLPANGSGFPSLSYVLAGAVFLLAAFIWSFMRKKIHAFSLLQEKISPMAPHADQTMREELRARYLRYRRAMPRNGVLHGNDLELQPGAVNPAVGINDGFHLLSGGVGVGLEMGAPVTVHPYASVGSDGAATHATTSTSTIARPPPIVLVHAGTHRADPAAPITHPNTTHSHPPRPHHGKPRRPMPPASLADSSASHRRPAHYQHERTHGLELTPSLTHPNTLPHRIDAPCPQHRHGQSPVGILAQVNDISETMEEMMRIAADEEDLFNQ